MRFILDKTLRSLSRLTGPKRTARIKKLLGAKGISRLKSLSGHKVITEDDNLIIGIDTSWSTDYKIGIGGWIISKRGPLEKASITINGKTAQIKEWLPRPDLMKKYEKYLNSDRCGFVVQIPRKARHECTFGCTIKEENSSRHIEKNITLEGKAPSSAEGVNDGSNIFNEFVEYVNDNRLRVLEIGSRVVSPRSRSKRELFPNAASYVGFDYYPDANTDVVGDAHELSKYFPGQKFDAIFSLVVLEHIAMPWILAREISKLLDIGGVTCHVSVHSWALHETPWDFWRFSDEGLKVLFSPPLGFETIKAGLFEPVRLYMDSDNPLQEYMVRDPGFAGCCIYARKVSECDFDKLNWGTSIKDVLGPGHFYPEPVV